MYSPFPVRNNITREYARDYRCTTDTVDYATLLRGTVNILDFPVVMAITVTRIFCAGVVFPNSLAVVVRGSNAVRFILATSW